MIDTITQDTFTDAMTQKGFGFSYEGANALFNYLEDLENDTDTKIEFDPIAFRCDFTEYENLKEIQDNYQDIKNIDDLENNTTVIQVPNTKKIIIQNY
jgi:hypothetical protein